MKAGLSKLQTASSLALFHASYLLYKEKWSAVPESLKFLDYFEENWIRKNHHWYEGSRIGYPSTNNGLESTNAALKKLFITRNRMSVRQFLSLVEERVLRSWSLDRDERTGTKSFKREVTLSTPLWKDGVSWARLNRTVYPDGSQDTAPWKSYAESSSAPNPVTPEMLIRFKAFEVTCTAFPMPFLN